MLTVALLSSTNRAIMQTDPNAHRSLIGPFCASGIWSVPWPRWRNSHPATRSYSPLRELAADGIRDRRKYPLTYQDLAAELSTSAVTVKVAKRSPSGPDTAGASGPGLAPPPGAARSIRFARAAYRPRVPPPRAAADHQGLVERSQRAARIRTHQAGSSASQPSLIRTPMLADRHVMSARSEPACSAIASPMGSFTERPG
jgi:hypothetical protein